ncbi:hypothetical protein WG66_010588 [Moniliophthora roreri]|nr:hypothetical protein WG66_010588 [Moniliophthora roreri]
MANISLVQAADSLSQSELSSLSLGIDLSAEFDALYYGFLIPTILFGVTVVQIWTYASSNKDPWYLRLLIAILFLMDLSTTVLMNQQIHDYFVVNFGNILVFTQFGPVIVIEVIVTGLVMCTVELFFASRIYKLGRVPKIVPACIVSALNMLLIIFAYSGTDLQVFCSLAALVPTIVGAVDQTKNNSVAHFASPAVMIEYGLASGLSTLADILASVTLSWSLKGSATGFKETDTLLQRLFQYFVARGLLVAVIHLCFTVTFLIDPLKLTWVPFHLCLSKLYVISIISLKITVSWEAAFEHTCVLTRARIIIRIKQRVEATGVRLCCAMATSKWVNNRKRTTTTAKETWRCFDSGIRPMPLSSKSINATQGNGVALHISSASFARLNSASCVLKRVHYSSTRSSDDLTLHLDMSDVLTYPIDHMIDDPASQLVDCARLASPAPAEPDTDSTPGELILARTSAGSPTPTEVTEPETNVSTRPSTPLSCASTQIDYDCADRDTIEAKHAAMGIKSRDYASVPLTRPPNNAAPRFYISFRAKDAIAQVESMLQRGAKRKAPIPSTTLARLIEIDWYELPELQLRLLPIDWSELAKYNAQCVEERGAYIEKTGDKGEWGYQGKGRKGKPYIVIWGGAAQTVIEDGEEEKLVDPKGKGKAKADPLAVFADAEDHLLGFGRPPSKAYREYLGETARSVWRWLDQYEAKYETMVQLVREKRADDDEEEVVAEPEKPKPKLGRAPLGRQATLLDVREASAGAKPASDDNEMVVDTQVAVPVQVPKSPSLIKIASALFKASLPSFKASSFKTSSSGASGGAVETSGSAFINLALESTPTAGPRTIKSRLLRKRKVLDDEVEQPKEHGRPRRTIKKPKRYIQ